MLFGNEISPGNTYDGAHVFQTIKTPVVESSRRRAEDALNVPAGNFTKLLCADAALLAPCMDSFNELREAVVLHRRINRLR